MLYFDVRLNNEHIDVKLDNKWDNHKMKTFNFKFPPPPLCVRNDCVYSTIIIYFTF